MSTIIATDQPTSPEVLVLGVAKLASGKIQIQSAGFKITVDTLEK